MRTGFSLTDVVQYRGNNVLPERCANIPWRDERKSSFFHMGILSSKHLHIKLCSECHKQPRYNKSHSTLCVACHNKYQRDYAREHHTLEKGQQRFLLKNYGITKEEYDLMLFQQCGVCAICGQPETLIHGVTKQVQALSVDHNHETGDVRELLCNRCNKLLGYIERDQGLAKKVIKYLKKHDR